MIVKSEIGNPSDPRLRFGLVRNSQFTIRNSQFAIRESAIVLYPYRPVT